VQKVELPEDAWFVWDQAGWLAVRGRTPWDAGGVTLAADVVAVIRLDDFLAGERRFRVVFEPTPRRAVQGMFWSDGALILSVLDELRPEYLVLRPGAWMPEPLAGLPAVGTVNAWTLDQEEAEEDGSLLALVRHPRC
jgi:prolyl oligopeptidase